MKFIIPVILSIFLISLASASISCSPNTIYTNTTIGNSAPPTQITCTNPSNTSITCWFNFATFTTTPSTLAFENLSSLDFQINYNTQNLGRFNDYLFCPDSTIPLNVRLDVNPSQTTQPPGQCNLGSSLSSLTQAMEQNTQYSLPKITFEPIGCTQGSLILDSSHIRVTGGVILGGLQKPVSISSIVSDGVNLAIDTRNLNTQSYVSNLEINAFGKTFQIPITIVVTSGASDITSFDCSQIPVCTITNSIMSLNNSNSLVCTKIPSNVKVVPIIDNNYIIGTNVETTNTQYIWYFKGIKNGISKVKASFTYLDAPVCTSFSQDVSIQSSGVASSSNNLKLIFTPELSSVRPNQDVIIQIAETGSNSLIPGGQLMIDAVNLVSNDSYTFHTSFVSNKNYTLRAMATGYADLVQSVALNTNPIYLNITPEKGDSDVVFSISSNPSDTSLFLDGNKVENPFSSTISPGSHELRAIKEGYLDGVMNITIDPAVFVTPSGEFKKGARQVFLLNKNSTCQVNYRKTANSQTQVLIPPQIGTTRIEFTPNNNGIYEITCNGIVKYTQEIKGFNWNAKWWFMAWYYWVIFFILLILIVRAIAKKSKQTSMSVPIGG